METGISSGLMGHLARMQTFTCVERATTVSVNDFKGKVLQYQRFMKTQFAHQVQRHSPCLEL